jgi:hypothetical protein
MTVRKEIEMRLADFAATNKLPLAYENANFTKPAGEWLEIIFLTPNKLHRSVAAGVREEGMFQVNVFTRLGIGSGRSSELVEQVSALFPVLPKVGLVSIEQPPNAARGFPDENHWCVPITVRYRAEH